MTPEVEALGRRAVACKSWRWMPGMVAIHPNVSVSRVLFGRGYRFVGAYRRELKTKSPSWWQGWSGQVQHDQYGYAGFEHCTPIPDLTDPATLGCLLALVREAHRQDSLSPVKVGRYRWCLADYGTTALDGGTEAELLVAPLQAAP